MKYSERFNYNTDCRKFMTEEQEEAFINVLQIIPRYSYEELFDDNTYTSDFYRTACGEDSKFYEANKKLTSVGFPQLDFTPIDPCDCNCTSDYWFNDDEIKDPDTGKVFPAYLKFGSDEWFAKRALAEKLNGKLADTVYEAVESWIEEISEIVFEQFSDSLNLSENEKKELDKKALEIIEDQRPIDWSWLNYCDRHRKDGGETKSSSVFEIMKNTASLYDIPEEHLNYIALRMTEQLGFCI